jgi:tetratricopeptide (TPR) repeat protein
MKMLPAKELNAMFSVLIDEATEHESEGNIERAIKMMKRALLIAEHQYGDRSAGETFRKRKDGTVVKDWPLFDVREMIVYIYINQFDVTSLDIALAYATETRAELEMRRNNHDDPDKFFQFMFAVDSQLGDIHKKKMQFDKCLHHVQEALVAARYFGPTYSKSLYHALSNLANTHVVLKTGDGANFAEEAYNLASEEFGPEHPEVHEAATILINIYQDTGNFVDAERFARINYESLNDPNNNVDRESDLFALGKNQVARLWLLTPPNQRIGGEQAAEEAETLSREACAIFEGLEMNGANDPMSSQLGLTLTTLAEIMMVRDKVTPEVEGILHRALTLSQDCRRGVVPKVKSSYDRYHHLLILGRFYVQLAATMPIGMEKALELKKALGAYEESARICEVFFEASNKHMTFVIENIAYVASLLRTFVTIKIVKS